MKDPGNEDQWVSICRKLSFKSTFVEPDLDDHIQARCKRIGWQRFLSMFSFAVKTVDS